ncbi:Polymerase/histidinol phosphatase-like protein [Kickxella alabastrina]|uniref:Polymerase/histidinol phosphatase-like protein n=1 Tax=Kickxella alabastrina TaxID=61397 RepID=UPI00221F057C|nr:Polymerase/histidinol phosphatase-like protein [Kickxella alabastrina]KAI7827796.1 Polymerase/histidinol phosphatase-like protein [Kickxella alabastrina]
MHSGQFCRHASGSLEAVIKAAIDKGMIAHVPRSRTQDLYPEESDMAPSDLSTAFAEYVSEAQRLRANLQEAKQLRANYQLDYLVGSLHHIDEMPLDFSQASYDAIVLKYGGDRAAMFRRYFDLQLDLLRELQPEVIGHFDLVRIFHPYGNTIAGLAEVDPLEDAFSEVRQLAVRNIEYAIGYGAIFEINSRAWKKGLRDAYPQRDLLAEILSRGGRVTISDDSHGAQDVCMFYGRLAGYLREMDINRLHYLARTPEGAVEADKQTKRQA